MLRSTQSLRKRLRYPINAVEDADIGIERDVQKKVDGCLVRVGR